LRSKLQDISERMERRLTKLGCSGRTIVSGEGEVACDDLIAGFVEELYGNIIKHADPEQGYFVTLGNPGKDIVISVCDAPINSRSESEEPTTIGLLRYQEILQAHGGSMTIRSANHLWTATVTIPLINTSTSAGP